MNSKRRASADTWVALGLTVILAVIAIRVSMVMFEPSDRDAVIAAMTQEAEEILAAVKTYPERAYLFLESQPADSMDTEIVPEPTFTGLRFDRIGYFTRLTADARTMYTEVGRFSLQVAPDGQSFALTAYGPEDISLQWSGRIDDATEPANP